MSTDPAANNTPAPETVPAEEFQKVLSRAQRFEGQLKDTEVRLTELSKRFEGVDVDEYRASKVKLEEAEKKLAESDPKKTEEYYEKKLDKTLKGWQAEKDDLVKERDTLKSQVKTLAVTEKVMNEIGGLFNDDGAIYVKDENGKPAMKGFKQLTVKDLGEQLAEKYPSMARSTVTGGSRDTAPGSKTRTPGMPQTYAELAAMPNPRETLEKMKRENPEMVQKILATAPIGAR